MYMTIPSIRKKDDFVIDITKSLLDPNFTTEGHENIKRFLNDLIGYYVIMEGIFFYAGFAMMLSFKRSNKMVGTGEQFQYILRDESVHLAFGIDLINTIIAENPEVWTEEFKKATAENIRKAVDLEIEYTKDCIPNGLLGLTSDTICQYVKYTADRRLERLNLSPIYNERNPFPWLSEIIDLRKEKNFFETRVTEYKTGGQLEW
jgi:ribonucleoside-diphosphate reductase beta chain